MALFVRLARLTEKGLHNVGDFQGMIGEARKIMDANGVKLVHAWCTLGAYDVVAVIDAPDAATAAQVSALIGAQGNFRTETLPAVPVEEFAKSVQRG